MPRLSHSAVAKYLDCGQAYKLQYIERYREKTTTSALLFGSAIDAAFNALLIDLQKGVLKDALTYKEAFDKAWTYGEINRKKVYLPDTAIMGYAATDFDHDILHEDDVKFLGAKAQELVPTDFTELGLEGVIKKCAEYKKQKAHGRAFKDSENRFLNLANWCSLRRKGHLMVEQYFIDILPKIKRVVDVQVKIETDNEQGDSAIGFIDAILEWEDGTIFPIDHKTSARDYEADSVRTSQQLAFYGEMTGYEKAAFIVFYKGVVKNRTKICSVCKYDGSGARHKTCSSEVSGKRCGGEWVEVLKPSIRTQVIIDKVTQMSRDNIMNTFDQVNTAVRAQIFPHNYNSCVKPYGRCAFFNICHEGKYDDVEKT